MDITLRLGEWAVLRRGWLRRRRLMFAGESSPGIFSVVAEWTEAHNSAAYHLYFHEDQREFSVFKGRVTVLGVTQDELRFRFDRRWVGG